MTPAEPPASNPSEEEAPQAEIAEDAAAEEEGAAGEENAGSDAAEDAAAAEDVAENGVPEESAAAEAAAENGVSEEEAAGEQAAAGRRDQLKLHHLRPAPGSKRRKVRVGRGESGRRGKTAGRGMKGRLARGKMRPGFEGGQTPLQSRIPHLRGFKPVNRREFTAVNVDALQVFPPQSAVSVDDLRRRGLARKRGLVKVLGRGELDRPLVVQAHAFSASARTKIEAAGGQCEIVE